LFLPFLKEVMYSKKKTNPLLEIKNIVKEYKLPRENFFNSTKIIRALDGVSLAVEKGESFGIVGESGCGKSTLARTILGLESPKSGEVIFKEKNLHAIKTKDLRYMRRSIQMIFQDPYDSLDPRQRVSQIVAEPLILIEKITPKEKQEKVLDALENVGLSNSDLKKYPHEFSGGQRQRIAIARALITRPSLIVADEPVSALDVSVQAQVLNLMMDLQDQHGLAYLLISHDLNIVRHITNKVAVMYSGRVVEKGTTQTLFKNPLHPYTLTMIEAIPQPDPNRKKQNRKKFYLSNSINSIRYPKTEIGCSYASYCPYVLEICRKESPSLKNIKSNFSNVINKRRAENFHEVACFNPLD